MQNGVKALHVGRRRRNCPVSLFGQLQIAVQPGSGIGQLGRRRRLPVGRGDHGPGIGKHLDRRRSDPGCGTGYQNSPIPQRLVHESAHFAVECCAAGYAIPAIQTAQRSRYELVLRKCTETARRTSIPALGALSAPWRRRRIL